MNEKQKVKTAKCGDKAMPKKLCVAGQVWSWLCMEETSDSSQSIQPGIVLATGTEAKAKEGQADHPADHAAGGAIVVSDEAPAVTEEEWKQQLKWEKEADEAFRMTKEEKAEEAEYSAEYVRKRRAEFEAAFLTKEEKAEQSFEFQKLEFLRRRNKVLKQELEQEELKQQKEQEEQEEHEADLEWPRWKSEFGRHLIQKAAGTSGTSR